jgi:hypothetical protein
MSGEAMANMATRLSERIATLNGKMLELMRLQADATLGFWRALSGTTSMADAVTAQTSGLRQHYEATAACLRDIAESAGRAAMDTMDDAGTALRKATRQD